MEETLYWGFRGPLAGLIILVLVELFLITVGILGLIRWKKWEVRTISQETTHYNPQTNWVPEGEEGLEGVEG